MKRWCSLLMLAGCFQADAEEIVSAGDTGLSIFTVPSKIFSQKARSPAAKVEEPCVFSSSKIYNLPHWA